MIDLESPTIYRKRRHGARDYFLQVPERRIDLNMTVSGRGADEHLASYGLDALRCDSVACLAGWLFTWPDYRDWAARLPSPPRGPRRKALQLNQFYDLCEYLGLNRGKPRSKDVCDESNLFAARWDKIDGPLADSKAMTDKMIALRRLDLIIEEADRACGCPS